MYPILIHIVGWYLEAPLLLKPPLGCGEEAVVLINIVTRCLTKSAPRSRACGLVWYRMRGPMLAPPISWQARLHSWIKGLVQILKGTSPFFWWLHGVPP